MNDVVIKKASGASRKRPVGVKKAQVVRHALLVLGMHRSGTSAVASVLSRLGAVEPKTLLRAGKDNPKGYSESRVVMEFNDRLLKSAGTTWSDVDAFNDSWMTSPVSEAFKREAVEIIRGEFGDSSFISLKDPRICRFAGFWLERLAEAGYETRVVIPYRNPLEVAESLRKRNGFSQSYSLLLWLRHVLDAEAATRHCIRSFISYEEMLADWEEAVGRVGRDLNISWSRWSAAVRNEIDQFLSAELRHSAVSEHELLSHGRVPALIKDAYAAFSDLAKGDKQRERALERLDQIGAQFRTICEVTAPALASGMAAADQLARQEKAAQASAEQMEAIRRDNEDLKVKLAVRAEEDKQRVNQAAALKSELETLKSRNEDLKARLASQAEEGKRREAALQSEVGALKIELASQADEAKRHQKQTGDLAAELKLLKQSHASMERESEKLSQALNVSRSELEALKISHAAERNELRDVISKLSSNNERLAGHLSASLEEAKTLRASQQVLNGEHEKFRLESARDRKKLEQELAQAGDIVGRLQHDNEEFRLESIKAREKLEQELAEAHGLVLRLQEDIGKERTWSAQLKNRIGALEINISSRFKELAKLTEVLMGAEAKLGERIKEKVSLNEQLERLRTEKSSLNEELGCVRQERASLESQIEQAKKKLAVLNEQLERARKHIVNMEHSSSWKLTAPLRGIRKALVRKPRPTSK